MSSAISMEAILGIALLLLLLSVFVFGLITALFYGFGFFLGIALARTHLEKNMEEEK